MFDPDPNESAKTMATIVRQQALDNGAFDSNNLLMQNITNANQLEVGKLYWLEYKTLNLNTELVCCEEHQGHKYFGPHKIWATKDNPQAFERWNIHGPVTPPSFEDSAPTPFVVTVNKMQESHRNTYWVCLDRGDRPKDAKPWDGGRITPFKHECEEYADQEAQRWAEFLGVEVSI